MLLKYRIHKPVIASVNNQPNGYEFFDTFFRLILFSKNLCVIACASPCKEKGDANELFRKIEYELVPTESFSVLRNCSGCGTKTHYRNTKRFRTNANGNKLDVWLIYQCEKCKHTLNLTIYERQAPTAVPKEAYNRFFSNDEEFAENYGRNFLFFKKNKAEIDWENVDYEFVKRRKTKEEVDCGQSLSITIQNPCGLKIRLEKQIAEVLGLSRSQVKKMLAQEEIQVEAASSQVISIFIKNRGC